MGQKREIVRSFVAQGLKVIDACSIAHIKKSSYYYVNTGTRKGKLPSEVTNTVDGKVISNEQVVKEIESILSEPFIDYGYHRTTHALKNEGYIINHKKVFRLMKQAGFLHNFKITSGVAQTYVKYTCPNVEHVFELLEMDIKYIYIAGERRNAMLLSLIDVASRFVVAWRISYQMKSNQVAKLLAKCKEHPLVQRVLETGKVRIKIRTDNGPQFISRAIKQATTDLDFDKENIRKATPEQNAHIESFHHTLQKLIGGYEFDDLEHAQITFEQFYHTYNYKRIMKSILHQTPAKIIELWLENKVEIRRVKGEIRFFYRKEAELNPASSPLKFFSNDKITGQNNNFTNPY